MKLEGIQLAAYTALVAGLAGTSIPILMDDGTFGLSPAHEGLLGGSPGCVVTIWQIEGDSLLAITDRKSGECRIKVFLPVVVEENPTVNRGNGTDKTSEEMVRLVMEALQGKPTANYNHERFMLDDPPFRNMGKVDGIQRWVVQFTIENDVFPK